MARSAEGNVNRDKYFWLMVARKLRQALSGHGSLGKTVKPKNPRRVEGGRKAAVTRKRNKEAQTFAVVTPTEESSC